MSHKPPIVGFDHLPHPQHLVQRSAFLVCRATKALPTQRSTQNTDLRCRKGSQKHTRVCRQIFIDPENNILNGRTDFCLEEFIHVYVMYVCGAGVEVNIGCFLQSLHLGFLKQGFSLDP